LDAKSYDDVSGERRLNQYVLGELLGKGSFGTVYKAYDKDANRFVALKEFSKSKLRKQKAQKTGGPVLFGRGRGRGRGGLSRPMPQEIESAKTPENPMELVRGEIAILKKLNHINVVKLFEVLDDPNQVSSYLYFTDSKSHAVI
jgi:[calcium/calmodulin-dependent protein kinase] kinase